MTSVSIISSVADRINQPYLLDESKHSESWKKLRSGLENIKEEMLKNANKETKRGLKFVELEKKIVQLSYKIDDAIAASHGQGFLSKLKRMPDLDSLATNLQELEKEIQAQIKAESKQTKKIVPPETTSHEAANPAAIPTGEGSTQAEKEVTVHLLKENLAVVCIWGESGMGKSTLARKTFKDDDVRKHFEHFAWVFINQDFQTKKVLQAILEQLSPHDMKGVKAMDEIELSQNIFTQFKEKRCLVVLEDMENVQDWQIIRIAFPIGTSTNSKILITTPLEAVAQEANKTNGLIYDMKPLSEAECSELLREKAGLDDHESRLLGKTIFTHSGGSPLNAGILGKYIMTLDVAARSQFLDELDSYRSQTSDRKTQVLELCYDKLSHELKPCLLYMGQFPKGKDIDAEKLYLLLAAEDLISREDSGTMPMESITKKMKQLYHRGLVQVQKDKSSRTTIYKSCRLHDQIRRLCISKGLNEEFFKIVDFKSKENLRTSTCRLAIYLSKYEDEDANQFISQDMVKQIRCLLIFDTYESKQKSSWPGEINDLKEFIHLRVLDFDGVAFRDRKLPKGIDKLVLLRYLSFRECYLETLPSCIAKLPFLETLDLRVTPDCKMTIPNVLSNLKRLRHLYFPSLYQSDGNGKLQLHGLEMLEVLVNFDTGACSIKHLSQLKNLKILTTTSEGNHKDLEDIVEYLSQKKEANLQQSSLTITNFDCFSRDRVTAFKQLLQCKSLHSLHIEGQIGDSLEKVEISGNFTEMVFNGSELESDPMNVLGKLDNLRSLTLSHDAFIGDEMTFSAASEFSSLRFLKLLNLQYLEKLTFEQGALPKLSTLVIDECDYLKEILMPKALEDRLRHAQGKKTGDAYSVQPLPTIIH